MARNKARDIEEYETRIVEKYRDLDIYQKKKKNYKQISFNDLTLNENLNYVKYSLQNTHEAFSLFDITKPNFPDVPFIAAALV